jgi:hypothetical protein
MAQPSILMAPTGPSSPGCGTLDERYTCGSREQELERTAAIRTNAAKRIPVRDRTTDTTQHRDTARQPRSANYSPPTPRWDQIALMRTYFYRLYSLVL